MHSIAPWVKVGVIVAFDGASGWNSDKVTELTKGSDVYILTYYPLGADFKPKNPDSPFADFPKMLSLAKDKPLVLQEVGYPSSPALSSSEENQAKFVVNVFKAWSSA